MDQFSWVYLRDGAHAGGDVRRCEAGAGGHLAKCDVDGCEDLQSKDLAGDRNRIKKDSG